MKCWQCENEARAACRFCGRFVCKEHAKTLPTFVAMFLGGESTPKGLVVADAIWCGVCEPQPEPIGMPELF
ncbi:MAG: hypothetical protein JXB15_01325 [Anaerolineales bacterium]|nr:hypothetical protein [Anaerolineales bacterium]